MSAGTRELSNQPMPCYITERPYAIDCSIRVRSTLPLTVSCLLAHGDAMHHRPHHWLSLPALLVALTASVLEAQERASIEITVRAADDDRPLPGAEVRVIGLPIAGTTDERGRLRIGGVPGGEWVIDVRLLGYAAFVRPVTFSLREGTALNVELTPEPIKLGAVDAASPSVLTYRGFYDRQKAGTGTFLDRGDLDRLRPRYMSDVLRRVGGIYIGDDSRGAAPARIRGQGRIAGACPIQFFLDGVPTPSYNIGDMQPNDVEGIEIYRGASSIPADFNRGTAMCGAILIWTRVR